MVRSLKPPKAEGVPVEILMRYVNIFGKKDDRNGLCEFRDYLHYIATEQNGLITPANIDAYYKNH